ncbi:MAG TPA: HAD hydrolase-like protein [Candidatus Nitrosotalea sp.]|nr:HAD hydrolase-like protein [Candidatus Nitrosotalea sp.]
MRLVIFDLDDTLIDNTLLDVDSFKHTLYLFSLQAPSGKTIVRWRKNGMIATNIFRRLVKKRDRPLLERLARARLDYLSNGGGGLGLVRARDGAIETLDEIKRKGNLIAVVSSRKDRAIIKKILREIGLSRYVDGVYCAADCKDCKDGRQSFIELKVKLYRLALSDHQSHTDEKPIAVGNLVSDIVSARRLGILPIAIRGSYRFDSGISRKAKTIGKLRQVLGFL